MTQRDEICGHPPRWQEQLINGYPPHYNFLGEICRSCFRAAFSDPNLVKHVPAKGNATGAIKNLAALGYRVSIASACPESVYFAVTEWLAARGILKYIWNFTVNCKNKGRYALANDIDFFVEDSPDNVKDIWLMKPDTEVFIVDYPYNKFCPGIRVRGLMQVGDYLGQRGKGISSRRITSNRGTQDLVGSTAIYPNLMSETGE